MDTLAEPLLLDANWRDPRWGTLVRLTPINAIRG